MHCMQAPRWLHTFWTITNRLLLAPLVDVVSEQMSHLIVVHIRICNADGLSYDLPPCEDYCAQ